MPYLLDVGATWCGNCKFYNGENMRDENTFNELIVVLLGVLFGVVFLVLLMVQ